MRGSSIQRSLAIMAGLALLGSGAVSAPAAADYAPDPDSINFSVAGYSGPGDDTVQFTPTAAAAQMMRDGKNLYWTWGDGTSCQSNPSDPGYVADPDSQCSDPTDITHTYARTPGQVWEAYWVDVAPNTGYGSGEQVVPGRPLYPHQDWADVTTYDDQPVTLDLAPFVTRLDVNTLQTGIDHVGRQLPGTATVDAAHRLVITPDGSGHGVTTLGVGFYTAHFSGPTVQLNVDIQSHTAAQVSAASCKHTAHTGRYSCAIDVTSKDRRHTSSAFTTTVTNASGKRAALSHTVISGGQTKQVVTGLAAGTYRVTVTNADHRSTTRMLAVGPRTPVARSGVRITTIRFDPPGTDDRSTKSLDAEWVRVKNTTTSARTITGWTLRDAQSHAYTFPATTIAAGATLRVHTGAGPNGRYDRYWNATNYIWNNSGDTATLRNAQRTVVSRCTYSGGSTKTC